MNSTHVTFNAFGLLWHAEGNYISGCPSHVGQDVDDYDPGEAPYFDADVLIYPEEYAQDTYKRTSALTLETMLTDRAKGILFECANKALAENVR